jgi:hypothetical protein
VRLTPSAATLLALMAEGWQVEPCRHDGKEFDLVKRLPYYDGNMASALAELAEHGLVDKAASGRASWINANGRATAQDLAK